MEFLKKAAKNSYVQNITAALVGTFVGTKLANYSNKKAAAKSK